MLRVCVCVVSVISVLSLSVCVLSLWTLYRCARPVSVRCGCYLRVCVCVFGGCPLTACSLRVCYVCAMCV